MSMCSRHGDHYAAEIAVQAIAQEEAAVEETDGLDSILSESSQPHLHPHAQSTASEGSPPPHQSTHPGAAPPFLNALEKHNIGSIEELVGKYIPKQDVLPLTCTLQWMARKTYTAYKQTHTKRRANGDYKFGRSYVCDCGATLRWRSRDGDFFILDTLPVHSEICAPKSKLYDKNVNHHTIPTLIFKNLPCISEAVRKLIRDGGTVANAMDGVIREHPELLGAPKSTFYSTVNDLRKRYELHMDLSTSHDPPPAVHGILSDVYAFEKALQASFKDEMQETDAASRIQSNRLLRCKMSYLNHGGFGMAHTSTLQLRQHYTELCYASPMVYHRSLVPALVTRARKNACEFLGIREQCSQGFSFTSISSALFTILDSVVQFRQCSKKHAILVSDNIYHSVADMLLHLSETKSFEIVTVDTPHGASTKEIYNEFEQSLTQSRARKLNIVLALFDHVSSKPTVYYPVKKICDLCRSLKIPTLVDGAHVPGGIQFFKNIGVPDIGATFYVVTFHKWCNTPRGGNSGGIWVNTDQVQDVYNTFIDISRVVVHGGRAEEQGLDLYLDASKPGYLTDGLTQGIYDESTREYENIMVLPHCLELIKTNEAEFEKHKSELREKTIEILSKAWDLDRKEATRWGNGIGYESESLQFVLPMLCVPLPTLELCNATATRFQNESTPTANKAKHHLAWLKKNLVSTLWQKHAIEVPVFVWKNKVLGVRISFGPCVAIRDIHRLGSAVNQIIEKGM